MGRIKRAGQRYLKSGESPSELLYSPQGKPLLRDFYYRE